MFVHYRTQGFILKKEDRGEADQLFTIYTKDFGKLEILGKAIRKISSKLRSGAELFYLSEIEFIQGKAHKTLTDAIVIEKHKNIRQNLEKLKVAYQIAGVLDELVSGQEKDEKIWELLNEVFEKLKIENSLNPALLQKGGGKLEIIYYYFLWNLLSILGYQIDLYHCLDCQKKLLPGKLYFKPEPGIICEKCAGKVKYKKEISSDVIKILRLFLNKNWNTLSRLKITDVYEKSLKKISENYFSYYKKVG